MSVKRQVNITMAVNAVPVFSGVAVVIIGCLVIAGWVFDITILKSIVPDLPAMTASSALAFTLLGAALLLRRSEAAGGWKRRVAQLCAFLVVVISLIFVAEPSFMGNLWIDRMLFRVSTDDASGVYFVRMPWAVAIHFLLVASASLLQTSRYRQTRFAARVLASATLIIALVILTGYAFDATQLFHMGLFRSMALPTALAFILLSVGILFAQREGKLFAVLSSDTSGGIIARRLLPAAIVIPLLLGWLRLEGQRAGLYQLEVGTALFVLCVMFLLVVLVWWSASSLYALDVRQKAAENELRASQSLLDSIVENIPAMIFLKDAKDLRFVRLNKTAEELIGFSRDSLIGKSDYDFFPKSEADFFTGKDREVLNNKVLLDIPEEPIETKCQGSRILHTKKLPLLNGKGEPQFLLGISEDITERKRAQQLLEELLAWQRTILDSANYTIISTDPNGLILSFNKAAERLLQYSAEEVIGKETPALIHDPSEVASRAKELSEQLGRSIEPGFEVFASKARRNEIDEREWTYIRKDGSRFPVLLSITALRDAQGRLTGFLGIGNDITARKQAEEERDRFFTLSLDLLCIAGTDGYFKKLNPAFQTVLGYTDNELLASPFIDFVHADDKPSTVAEVDKLRTGAATIHFENRYRCKDGSYRWFAWTSFPVVADGLLYAVAHDITDLKENALEINRLNRELEKRVSELNAASQELEAFSYSVSHDLRAPLRHIDGFVRLLQKDARPVLDEKSCHYLDVISDSAKRMGALIDDLLAFSRMGRSEICSGSVALQGLVQEVVGELQSEAKGRDVIWNTGELPVVEGDAALLRVALFNLLSNALKYTRARTQARIEIKFSVGTHDRELIFSVADNGVGFDMAYVDKLFGVFQRLHRPDEFEGTGIGLATVRRVIHRHGGRVWAEGEVDKGATFYFTLKRAAGESDGSKKDLTGGR